MKIAVTYEDGNVFGHFGKTKNFKIYETQDYEILSGEVISAGDAGHEALASFLAEKGVDFLICGGIGAGAQEALASAGIELVSGVSGDADKAVAAFLSGELVSEGVNCDHHAEGEGSCGGSCGGCHGCRPAIEGKNVGKTVRAHYVGTFNDGTVFDSSYDRGEPLEFVCGVGMMIAGFDKAVAEMEKGEIRNVHLEPKDAYGEHDENAVFTLEIALLPGSENLSAGQQVYLQNSMGQPVPVKVVSKTETEITFDANHEMAGKELNFKIELVEIL